MPGIFGTTTAHDENISKLEEAKAALEAGKTEIGRRLAQEPMDKDVIAQQQHRVDFFTKQARGGDRFKEQSRTDIANAEAGKSILKAKMAKADRDYITELTGKTGDLTHNGGETDSAQMAMDRMGRQYRWQGLPRGTPRSTATSSEGWQEAHEAAAAAAAERAAQVRASAEAAERAAQATASMLSWMEKMVVGLEALAAKGDTRDRDAR